MKKRIALLMAAVVLACTLTGCHEADKVNHNSSSELVVTCKVGANEYKKNYIYLNDYTLYVVEDITGTHADPYHYLIEFHTEFPVNVDVKP